MAAAIAGILAALLSSIIEVLVMGGMPPVSRLDPMLFLILAVAPVLEEGCKRGFSRLFAAPWGKVGLSFGIMEGVGKLVGLEEGSGLGFFISVLFHWGLGRHAQAGRWPLLVAIGAHVGYNLGAVGSHLLMGDLSSLVMLALSGLILWASFQRPVDAAASHP
jgi:hypothetical protein